MKHHPKPTVHPEVSRDKGQAREHQRRRIGPTARDYGDAIVKWINGASPTGYRLTEWGTVKNTFNVLRNVAMSKGVQTIGAILPQGINRTEWRITEADVDPVTPQTCNLAPPKKKEMPHLRMMHPSPALDPRK